MDITATDSAVETVCQALLAYSSQFADALRHVSDPAAPAVGAWSIADSGLRVLPLMLDRHRAAGLKMRLKLHIRHGSAPVIVIGNGTLHVEPTSSQPVDCQASVDPAAFLLVSFHRISPVRAALTGKIITWGRKPWLLLRLQSALNSV